MFKPFATMAFAFVAALSSQAASAETLRFGAGQQGSQNYGVNAALAQAIKTELGIDATVQSFGGPAAYLPLFAAGELDMAALVTPDVGDAVRGKGPFEGMAQTNLKLVAPLLPSPVGLMVRADLGIKTIADLKGKRVAWGIPAQASLLPYFQGALANGGVMPEDVEQVPVASVRNGVSSLVSGNLDTTLFALRGGAVVEADASVGGIRWLPFDSSAEAVARMNAVAPEAYLMTIGADAGVVGIKEPTVTMAYDYVLMVRDGVDDKIVAAVATMLRDKAAAIAASNPVLKALTAETVMRPYPSLPTHPAAAAVLQK